MIHVEMGLCGQLYLHSETNKKGLISQVNKWREVFRIFRIL